MKQRAWKSLENNEESETFELKQFEFVSAALVHIYSN